ncbi:RNA polymerase sigma factor [Moheibacter stercoris]|uniref:RNA polymerase sigma factor (Sigma-70 family) n=1 Tax=Moheibacter stercoris TaxID=1628251 RepID=A0ABV2LT70_9FLAO
MVDEDVKKYLKSNREEALFKIYDFYKPAFFQYANKYGLPADDLLDIYQDAFIALSEHAKKGKLDNLKSNVKTYFFAIGKYMVYNKLKDNKKIVNVDFMDELQSKDFDFNLEMEEVEQDNQSILLLQNAIQKLGGKCEELLRLFYYEEKNLDEIVEIMCYENKDVAKSQKSRCIKNLKNLIIPS